MSEAVFEVDRRLYIGDYIRMRYVLQYLPTCLVEGGKCLDIGSGQNIYKPLVEAYQYEWYGVDVNPMPPAINGKITEIPYKDEFFDAVICVDVIEHVEDDAKGIKEIVRVLKNGGVAVIHTPCSEQKHILSSLDIEDNPDHARFGYTEDQIKDLCINAGLKASIRKTFNPFEALAWDLFYAKAHGQDIQLQDIYNLAVFGVVRQRTFKEYGLLVLARK